jgi:hypothetical protein
MLLSGVPLANVKRRKRYAVATQAAAIAG